MKELVEKIREVIGDDSLEYVLEVRDDLVELETSRFTSVEGEEGVVSFVDGGNQSIFSTSTFDLQKLRVSAVTFDGLDEVETDSAVYYVLVTEETTFVEADDGVDVFDTEEDVVERIRTRFELQHVQDRDGVKVLDGNLDDDVIVEDVVGMDDVVGVSKTSSVSSRGGVPANFLIREFVDQHGIDVPFVLSLVEDDISTGFYSTYPERILRVDTTDDLISSVSSFLCHTRDPVMPGYPYGLIRADEEARVSNVEVEEERGRVKELIGQGDFDLLEESGNIHEVLDSLRF